MPCIYETLNIDKYEIRLLLIQRGPTGPAIEYKLERFGLFDLPSYAALSYCWGESADTVEILVNNVSTQITASLFHALQQLTQLGIKRTWADALCINQDDNQKKSLQIRHMNQIYSKADLTYAYVGQEDHDGAASALEFFQKLFPWQLGQRNPSSTIAEATVIGWLEPRPIFSHSRRRETVAWEIGHFPHACATHQPTHARNPGPDFASVPIETSELSMQTRPRDHDCPCCVLEAAFHGLGNLFKHEYWKRRWIIQEVVVSRNVNVLCGHAVIDLSKLEAVLKRCEELPFWQHGKHDAPRFFRQLMKIRKQYHAEFNLQLGIVISLTQEFCSRDPRDSIFALLGVCEDGPALVPTPSYSQSAEAVFCQLTRAFLRKYRCFELFVAPRRAREAFPRLPSWAIDWSSCGTPSESQWRLAVEKPEMSRYAMSRALGRDSSTLVMRGFVLGTVVSVTTPMPSSMPLGSPVPEHDSPSLAWASESRRCRLYYGCSSTVRFALAICLASGSNTVLRSVDPVDVQLSWHVFQQCLKDDRCQISDEEYLLGSNDAGSSQQTFRHWARQNEECLIAGQGVASWIQGDFPRLYAVVSIYLSCFWAGGDEPNILGPLLDDLIENPLHVVGLHLFIGLFFLILYSAPALWAMLTSASFTGSMAVRVLASCLSFWRLGRFLVRKMPLLTRTLKSAMR